ncbi:hypothetical protein D3C72_1326020 [compost metagenome]
MRISIDVKEERLGSNNLDGRCRIHSRIGRSRDAVTTSNAKCFQRQFNSIRAIGHAQAVVNADILGKFVFELPRCRAQDKPPAGKYPIDRLG